MMGAAVEVTRPFREAISHGNECTRISTQVLTATQLQRLSCNGVPWLKGEAVLKKFDKPRTSHFGPNL